MDTKVGRYGTHVRHEGNDLRKSMHSWHKEARTCQLFLGCRSQYKIKSISKIHREEIRAYLKSFSGTIHIHAPYCINLAKKQDYDPGPNATPKQKKEWAVYVKSITSLSEILFYIQDLPMTTVIHPGAPGVGKKGEENSGSLQKIVEHINMMQADGRLHLGSGGVQQQLLLEVAAEKGRFFSSWDDLAYVFGPNGVDKKYVGLCLDTAHLFGSGMCDFASYESIDLLFAKCDSLGAKVGLIHLNDSAAPYNSKKDKHMAFLFGEIWRNKAHLLAYFVFKCFDRGIDMVSESAPMFDMAIMNALAKVYENKDGAFPLKHADPNLPIYINEVLRISMFLYQSMKEEDTDGSCDH